MPAGADKETRRWVEDRLHAILGMSEKALVRAHRDSPNPGTLLLSATPL